MDIIIAFSIIALAALIHTSFQLGVSMVTLLSSNVPKKGSNSKWALRLVAAFLGGTVIMTTLVTATLSYLASSLFRHQAPPLVWAIASGVMVAVGLGVWIFYYRRGDGTTLWLPRSFARFLHERVRATKHSIEAFSLGMTSVIAELLFLIAPTLAAALALITLPARLQLVGVLVYVAVASLGMLVVTALIGSGHSLSRIQKWRENNKRFLQFAAGSGLIILGFYLYVNEVVAVVTTTGVL